MCAPGSAERSDGASGHMPVRVERATPSSLTLVAIEIVARVNGRQRTGNEPFSTPNTTVDPSTSTKVHPWRVGELSITLGGLCSNG